MSADDIYDTLKTHDLLKLYQTHNIMHEQDIRIGLSKIQMRIVSVRHIGIETIM